MPTVVLKFCLLRERPETEGNIMFYANIYEIHQAYGGPEEGGWYFKTYTPKLSVPCATRKEAVAKVGELRMGEWANEEDAREIWSVAYDGGRYIGLAETNPARFMPEEWPRYE